MNILIVEGNPVSIREQRQAIGATVYHERFLFLLDFLGFSGQHHVSFPADIDSNLPSIAEIKKFDAIMITGSSLNAYHNIPSVTRQLDFVETLFSSGVPIYGSCWGMQIATMVAGGVVEKSNKGREFGVSEPIVLNAKGKQSLYFKDKPSVYSSLCIHEDEVTQLAENTDILASNSHSDVQAMTLHFKKSAFFGVQYHPEFTIKDVLIIAQAISAALFSEEKTITNIDNAELFLEKIVPHTISNYALHTLEIKNFLKSIATR